MLRRFKRNGSLTAAVLLSGALSTWLAAGSARAYDPAKPEAATATAAAVQTTVVAGRREMVVTANAHATRAAQAMLAAGGTAIDAALAAQWMLGLVEPQSSGIGGGAFMLYWDAKAQTLTAWDGRETAPHKAGADFARKPDGTLARFDEIVPTGKSVGTPGVVAMLAAAHGAHGRLSWARSFDAAIALAEAGFAVSPRLAALLGKDATLPSRADTRALFYRTDGTPRAVGERLANPALAATYRQLAAGGAAAFHRGPLARAMAAAAQARGGWLSEADLAAYAPRRREAVCGAFRAYRVCSMPPPSSGGITVLQLLGIYAASGGAGDPDGIDATHRFLEAGRLAFADRARYIADPDFIAVPQARLLDADYLAHRAALIDPQRAMGRAAPGELVMPAAYAARNADAPATTHLSIVDAEGNALAMTSSVEGAFGSGILVEGFLLNNQMTDFSFAGERDGVPLANRLEPGKRPLSSMAPTLVFDADGALQAVLGSPGGPHIIGFVAQTLVALLDGRQAPERAVAAPRRGNRNGASEFEAGAPAAITDALAARGHAIGRIEVPSGLALIVRDGDGWRGVADPRREGTAAGR